MYNVISPDGFPISCEPFTTRRKAIAAIPAWTKRFEKQGYYLTARWEKIPLKYLRQELSIVAVSEDDLLPICCKNFIHKAIHN
jgi:hypothetical protein